MLFSAPWPAAGAGPSTADWAARAGAVWAEATRNTRSVLIHFSSPALGRGLPPPCSTRILTLPRPMLDDAERIDYFEVVAQYEFDAIEPFPPWHTKSKKGDAP